jgi:hypothetical protein
VEDLIDWLKAQISADQREAQETLDSFISHDRAGRPTYSDIDGMSGREVAHIVTWDPERVLNEIAAKQRIIAEIERTLAYEDHGHALAQEVLRQMVVPYADCDGFMQQWRP